MAVGLRATMFNKIGMQAPFPRTAFETIDLSAPQAESRTEEPVSPWAISWEKLSRNIGGAHPNEADRG
jgi:hypothetical protein